jgi:hypothetical protein
MKVTKNMTVIAQSRKAVHLSSWIISHTLESYVMAKGNCGKPIMLLSSQLGILIKYHPDIHQAWYAQYDNIR